MISKQQNTFYEWVVYQIYPRSFNDSNGDGIGDIKGITEKLDHLTELGVNAVWLSPCYKSPNEDNGYDIADYCDIMDEFGTLADWKEMIAAMHARGIRLIMDFVANHTSSEHRWFKESRSSKDNPYRDYYIWAKIPPNDWQSTFGGSAWEYDALTDEYYLHSFAKGQPDLNWDNPAVRKAMRDVIDFWVELGVDGFRCDVLDMIAKDFATGKNGNGPMLHTYIRELFDRDETAHLFTVGECWGADAENIRLFVDGDRGELSTVFQMEHICVGNGVSKFEPAPFTLADVRDVLVKWQTLMQEKDMLYTLFFENHDLPRCVSRFGNDNEYRYECATMMATMSFLHKGVPFIYQGQEIGTADSVSNDIADFRDIETIQYYNEARKTLDHDECMRRVNYASRDHARHPMAWNGGLHAGFSEAEPWQCDYARYREINVEADKQAERSVFRYFQKLIALRKGSDVIKYGTYENLSDNRQSYVYKRSLGDTTLVVVCNFEKASTVQLPFTGEVILSNRGRADVNGVYQPYECAVFVCKNS